MKNAPDPSHAIDVFDLARRGAAVEGRLDLRAASRLRTSLRDDAGSLTYRFECFTDRHGRPAAVLRLQGELQLSCDRCTQTMLFDVAHVARFYFVSDERELAELPVTVEEDEEPLLGSGQFDLAALVEDEAILSVPVSPRHAECPTSPRASGTKTPKNGHMRNPFSALPDLLNGKRR